MKQTTKKQASKPTILSYITPVISALVFTILASINLNTAMWFDESYSAYLIRGNFGQIWQMTSVDVHPPFYYFCLKIWSLIFGTSEFALRSMSVFFAGLGIVLAFFLLRRWFGEKAAALSTFALSLAPILIRYSQEMRMYGIVFAIVMGATLVLDIALKNKRKLAWFFYALLICLGMWTHYFTALAWIAHLAYIVYYFRKHGLQKTVFWTYPLAVGLYLPWLPSFFSQVKAVQNGFWIPPVNLVTPFSFVSESLIFRSADKTEGWFVLLVLAVIALTTYLLIKTIPKTEKEVLFLLSITFLPPAILMLLSCPPFQPTYVTRYVVYSASLIWVLVGLAIHFGNKSSKRLCAGLLAVFAFICAGIGIVDVNSRDNPNDARSIMAAIKAIDTESAPILVHVDAMDYYDLFFYESATHPVYAIDIDYIWGSLEPIRAYNTNVVSNADEYVASQNRFWVILPTENKDDYKFTDYAIANTIVTPKFTATEYQEQ